MKSSGLRGARWPAKVGEQRFSDHEGAGVVLARRED